MVTVSLLLFAKLPLNVLQVLEYDLHLCEDGSRGQLVLRLSSCLSFVIFEKILKHSTVLILDYEEFLEFTLSARVLFVLALQVGFLVLDCLAVSHD